MSFPRPISGTHTTSHPSRDSGLVVVREGLTIGDPQQKNHHLEKQLLLISINFTPETCNPVALKNGTLGFPGRNFSTAKTRRNPSELKTCSTARSRPMDHPI